MSEDTNLDEINKRLRELEIKHTGLDSRVSTSTIVFYAISLLLTVLGTVAGYNILTFRQWEDSRDNINKILVSNFEREVGTFFNSFSVRTKASDDQLTRWRQLNDQIESLQSVGKDDKRFSSLKTFISIIGDVCIYGEGLPQHQEEELDKLILLAPNSFMEARAIALKASIKLSRRNFEYDNRIENELLEAISKDPSVGLAWVSLGNMYGLKARSEFSKSLTNEGLRSMRLALSYHGRSHDLDNSLQGLIKYKNNRTWCEGLLFEAMLDGKLNKDEFLTIVGSVSPETFMVRSLTELEFCKKQQPDRTFPYETTAELYGLMAKYHTTVDAAKVISYAELSRDEYLLAIKKGLFATKTVEKATNEFRANTALSIVREKFGTDIELAITQNALP